MKKILSFIFVIISIALAIGMIVYVFNAYFILKVVTNEYFDGLGRRLYEPPLIIKIIYPDMQWPGIKNFVIDLVVFWVTAGIIAGFIKISSILNKET